MSRRWLLSLLCLLAVVVFVQLSSARSGLSVNEAATKFLIQDQVVVVLCSAGYTSSLAAATLQDMGFRNATDVAGGFQAWKAAGLPVG